MELMQAKIPYFYLKFESAIIFTAVFSPSIFTFESEKCAIHVD